LDVANRGSHIHFLPSHFLLEATKRVIALATVNTIGRGSKKEQRRQEEILVGGKEGVQVVLQERNDRG